MAEEREPVRDTYDAVIDMATNAEWGVYAFGLVKFTYRITPNGCVPAEAEPLFHDMRDEDIEPRIREGTDFWPVKFATDLVVQGAAYPPSGVPTDRMTAKVAIGGLEKRIAVFGRRFVRWTERSGVQFSAPEPFEEVDLTWANAYGGTDYRVVDPAMKELTPEQEVARLEFDHPGMYPRNPFGKGYLVKPDPVEDFELPQLEDPNDLLTPQRIITGDPKQWYEQPLPWAYEWVHPMMFPRYTHFMGGPEAWFPGPEDDSLPEVRRGFLLAGFKQAMEERTIEQGPDPRFRQGASYGFMMHDLPHCAPIRIEGMHPEWSEIRFRLPPSPILEMQVNDRPQRVQPRLHSIVLRPSEELFYVLYGGVMQIEQPRIPGVHKHIPMALYVNDDRPVVYEAPVPIQDQLADAMEQRGNEN